MRFVWTRCVQAGTATGHAAGRAGTKPWKAGAEADTGTKMPKDWRRNQGACPGYPESGGVAGKAGDSMWESGKWDWQSARTAGRGDKGGGWAEYSDTVWPEKGAGNGIPESKGAVRGIQDPQGESGSGSRYLEKTAWRGWRGSEAKGGGSACAPGEVAAG